MLNEDEFDDFLNKSVSDYDSGKLSDSDKLPDSDDDHWEDFPEQQYLLKIASKNFETMDHLIKYAEALGVEDLDKFRAGRQSSFPVKSPSGANFEFLVEIELI